MAIRPVDITLMAARDLHDANHFARVEAFGFVSIKGSQSYDKQQTPKDKENGRNPNWHHTLRFMVEEVALLQSELVLEIKICTKGTIILKEIGTVCVGLRYVVHPAPDGGGHMAGPVDYLTYPVRKPSGEAKGILYFTVKIGERTNTSVIRRSATFHPPPFTPYGSFYFPPPQHNPPYPPQGYPSQGYPPQRYSSLQRIPVSLGGSILVQDFFNQLNPGG